MKNVTLILALALLLANSYAWAVTDKSFDLRYCLELRSNVEIAQCADKQANKNTSDHLSANSPATKESAKASAVVASSDSKPPQTTKLVAEPVSKHVGNNKTVVPEDELLVLLFNGQYEKLDQKLQSLQKAYIANRSTENDIHKAVYQFYRADPRVGSALSNWITQRPNSAMAYLARGLYRTKTGWVNRGNNWASETSDSQFFGMAAWFDAAKGDLNRSIILDPTLVESYCYLIEIDMNEGGQQIETLFNKAIEINPSSFIAREFYLHSQLPRWGGSYDAMVVTIDKMKPYYDRNPQLRTLEGRIQADLGELAAYRNDYREAIKLFDIALAKGDFWFYNFHKGSALFEIGDYQGAAEQFSRVIRDKPGYKKAWWMRANSYKMLGQFSKSLADISYAINIEPNDDDMVAGRGFIYMMAGDLKSALNDFRTSAKLNPANPSHKQAILDVERLMNNAKP